MKKLLGGIIKISLGNAVAVIILSGALAAMAPIGSAWSQGGSYTPGNWGSVSYGNSADGTPTITVGGVTINVDKSSPAIIAAVERGDYRKVKELVQAAEAEQKGAATNDAKQNTNKLNEIKDKTNKENTNKLNANTIKSNTNKQNSNTQKGNSAGGSSNVTAVKTKTLTPTASNAALIKPKK